MRSELTGAPVPMVLRFHFITRVALLLHPLAVACFAWLAPDSLTGRMLLGVLDAVVNDLLPPRWSLPCVQRNRHIGYLVLGATLLMQVFAAASDLPPGGGVLIAYHLAASIVCGLFAAAATVRPSHANGTFGRLLAHSNFLERGLNAYGRQRRPNLTPRRHRGGAV